mgnify:CR=1 FL=1
MAKRAYPGKVKIQNFGGTEGIVVSCSHNGYFRIEPDLVHTRSWKILHNSISIIDKIGNKPLSAYANFHFHPDVTKRGYSKLKIYYAIKNSIILNANYFDYKLFRNIASILVVLLRVAKRNGVQALIRMIIGTDKKIFYMGILRGLKGNIGMDHES